MSDSDIIWEAATRANFDKMLGKIPAVLRDIARAKVSKKAEALVAADNRREVAEKDMVDAFFAATPFGFHGPMKCDMEEFGIDYTRYGHPQ